MLGHAAMERFFITVKVECVHQLRYGSHAEAKLDIVHWIEDFYNQGRTHSSINYQTQAKVESASGLHKLA